MIEVRCPKCNKLICKLSPSSEISVVCNRCKNSFDKVIEDIREIETVV